MTKDKGRKNLMYHGVYKTSEDIPKDREAGANLYDVTVDDFQKQIEWLQEHNYEVKRFGEHVGPESKQVILTFDDGEMNNCSVALPILAKAQFSAYFFIIAQRVNRPGYMGWKELKAMLGAGMILGSHGLSHEILTNLVDTQLEEELMASKKFLERNLDIEVTSMSIPRGFCNEKIIKMAHDVGYKEIFISDRPKDVKSTCYSRVAVKGNWTLQRFEQAVIGNTPIREQVSGAVRNSAKLVLRESGYNFVRSMLVKVMR